ncbi:TatD family hydrolase [Methylomonas sp. MS20]|uniref:TatD family hydrolase n=1 Tax=unclassified Methylomonas TaxID=2608980 RepID=UPI0028A4FB3C|nr:TatD family hydrolase [Methylomonas sp. MV1]MDT4331447.1 TatD family hydrolase [Methylomonas sp. MV1]
MYTDLHCHSARPEVQRSLVNIDLAELNTNDIDAVVAAAGRSRISAGLHPWHLVEHGLAAAFDALERLSPRLAAVGECGLDRCAATPYELQRRTFIRQIECAERWEKPLIVHCVRAYGDLLVLRQTLKPKQVWIVHGFTGKPGLAEQLVCAGCYLSFGKALLNPRASARDSWRAAPLDRVFLETDAADISIATIHAEAATIRGLDLTALQRQLVANFDRVFR